MPAKIKPCPLCGYEYPFTYRSVWTAVIECKCGLKLEGTCVTVVDKLNNFPEPLRALARPAECLIIKNDDGIEKHFPEHGYYGVSCVEAFKHYGHLDRWNRRAEENGPL